MLCFQYPTEVVVCVQHFVNIVLIDLPSLSKLKLSSLFFFSHLVCSSFQRPPTTKAINCEFDDVFCLKFYFICRKSHHSKLVLLLKKERRVSGLEIYFDSQCTCYENGQLWSCYIFNHTCLSAGCRQVSGIGVGCRMMCGMVVKMWTTDADAHQISGHQVLKC